jgi:hypothetical protein
VANREKQLQKPTKGCMKLTAMRRLAVKQCKMNGINICNAEEIKHMNTECDKGR